MMAGASRAALAAWTAALENGARLDAAEALALADVSDLTVLCSAASRIRDAGFGDIVTFSRKVFIPLTKLCRDTCRYCTFAHPPRRDEPAFLTVEDALHIARAGAEAGCDEALFTLGDKPELRYRAARSALETAGHATTLSYLGEVAQRVMDETGLLPHLNAGVMDEADLIALRRVSVSQGIMLETASDRLSARGGPHFGSPDKRPAVRLATIAAAGRARVPFTSGILIGIGETRKERIEALLALRDAHDAHGHLQEIIIQNFRAKPGTAMADAQEPSFEDHLWTIAVARLILGPAMSIQAPPNLARGALPALLASGLNDWGGVSPVTPDHVNPEAPWPEITHLAAATAMAGKTLAPRLAVYPGHLAQADRWLDPAPRAAALRRADGRGLAQDCGWRVGLAGKPAPLWHTKGAPAVGSALAAMIDRAAAGQGLTEKSIAALFDARGGAFDTVCKAADELRRTTVGDAVSYVVTRNINYTNLCNYGCRFCAFSKGQTSDQLRGRPYDLDRDEIARRVGEAWARGATEVCLQGGIHPDYTGETYLEILRTVKAAAPDIHIHAFSPLEVSHGATTLRLPIAAYLQQMRTAGLGTLPGTAAEILDDAVRARLCADKLSVEAWLGTVRATHRAGFRTTATIMFGHLDDYGAWARHLLHIRSLQQETGGFTEFVPLPFVHMEAPLYLRGKARQGPSFRETVLMHAVARLALYGVIPNIQVSWVKMGEAGVHAALAAGANDLGGTLMNESISRAAGSAHGQETAPAQMERMILAAGRTPRQRTTLYADAPEGQRARSFAAPPLTPVIQSPAGRLARIGGRRTLAVEAREGA